MRVLTVCGMGSGSSVILKMKLDSIFKNLGIDADIEAIDAGSLNQETADLIVTTEEFERFVKDCDCPVVLLSNIINRSEIEKMVRETLNV